MFASMVGLALGPTAMFVFSFSTVVPALQREFGWGIAATYVGATLIIVMKVVGSVIAGTLADRFGGRALVRGRYPSMSPAWS